MFYSERSSHESTQNELAVALDRLRANGTPWLALTESNPTRAGIEYDRRAILSALADERSLLYEPQAFGLASAREAVAGELGPYRVPAAQVVLTASTSEAYALLFKLLCDPGDDVLVPQPSYPLFELLARYEGVKLVPYRLAYDGEWHMDLDSIRRARGPRSRAVLAVSPNNPTGSYTKRSELRALAELGLPIVSDEVFATYSFGDDPRRATSALIEESVLVFSLGGLSKLAALPQMKLAWIAAGGPKSLVEGALGRLELICDSFLSVGTPVQHALPALLASRGPATQAIQARTRQNLTTLRAALGNESPASILKVEGGWYATLRLPETESEERWVMDLLEQDHVYVHPGHFFDFVSEVHVILSLLTRPDAFAEGARRIASRVARC